MNYHEEETGSTCRRKRTIRKIQVDQYPYLRSFRLPCGRWCLENNYVLFTQTNNLTAATSAIIGDDHQPQLHILDLSLYGII